MIIGRGSNLTEKAFFSLLRDYFLSDDEEECRQLANNILLYLEPLVEQVVLGFSVTDEDDLKQFCRVKLMFALDKWEPSRVTAVEGFFRQVCVNAAKDYPKKRTEREFKALSSYDSVENSYLIENYEGEGEGYSPGELEVGEEVFKDIYDNYFYNQIYQECLTLLIERASAGVSISSLVRELERMFPSESSWRLKSILQNAKITLREHYLDRTHNLGVDTSLESLDDSQVFKRMSKYLTEEQLEVILAVFSGCEIRVPSLGGSGWER